MPYVLTGRNIPDKEDDVHDYLGTAGMDIRYEPMRNVTAVASLNPDFSQLESQVTNIDFSDNEKLVNDPRPFFQEGAAYFGHKDNDELYFYTNRVPDFDVGAKYFAQNGKLQSGALLAQAPEGRWDTVARGTYEVDATNNLTTMLVATDRTDLSNQLFMARFDGRQPSGLNYRIDAGFTDTDTDEIEIGRGGEIQGDLGWSGDYWWVSSSADYFDKGFFPANGIQDSDTVGTKGVDLSTGYYRTGVGRFLRELDFSVSWNNRDTTDGLKQRRNWIVGGSAETVQQIRAGLFYSEGDYRPVAGNKRGEYVDFLRHDHFWTGTLDFNTRSNSMNYGLSVSDGFLGGDDYRYIYGYVSVRPTVRTTLNLTSERLDNFGRFNQTILSGNWDITYNDGVSFRYIDSDDGKYKRLAYRRTVREGIDIFAVYNEDLENKEEYSVKLLWTFN